MVSVLEGAHALYVCICIQYIYFLLDDTNGSGISSSSVAIIGGGIILLVLVTVSVVYTV